MPWVRMNGVDVYLPEEEVTGKEIKQAAGIPENRSLVQQNPAGNIIVPNESTVRVQGGESFTDAPTFQYG